MVLVGFDAVLYPSEIANSVCVVCLIVENHILRFHCTHNVAACFPVKSSPEKALEAVSVAGDGVLPGKAPELGVHLLVEVLAKEERPKSGNKAGF